MTFSTGNPVPSTDFRDLSDNSEAMDNAMNSPLPTFNDRLGVSRVSYNGFQAAFNTNEAARQATFDAGEATRAAFTADLANNSDPAKGAALVGYSGTTVKAKLDGLTTGSTPTFAGVIVQSVKFPAVQVPSADPNTLDDYEEGSWVPTFTFVTPGNLAVTYSTRSGEYTKIGRKVMTTYNIGTSAFTHTTAAGNAIVTGYPFATPLASATPTPVGAMSHNGIAIASGYAMTSFMVENSSNSAFYGSSGISGRTILTIANFPTGGTVSLACSLNYNAA